MTTNKIIIDTNNLGNIELNKDDESFSFRLLGPVACYSLYFLGESMGSKLLFWYYLTVCIMDREI
jgi:hypothetical protein